MRTGFLAGLLLGWAVAKQLRRKRYSVVREDGEAWMDADTIFLHRVEVA